ncbi:MAG: ABC transporter permease [Clostridia bacterium]
METAKTRFFRKTEFSLLLIVIGLFAIFTFTTNSFFSQYNLTNLLKQSSVIGIVAVSATIIIITGGIDLSCGAITGMSSLIVALLMTEANMSIAAATVIAVLAACVLGLYNAVIIYEFKVPPFIATLGSMQIIRGLIKVIGKAKTIAGLPEEFSSFSNGTILGIPNLTLIWLAVLLIVFFVLKFTRFGRNIYVIGSGAEVAKLSGVNTRLTTYGVYVFAGLICGIAGVLLTSRVNSAVPTAGSGYEMSAIAATVIGGASLSGAKGAVWGTALGTVLMILIDNGGIQLGINPFIMEVSTGVLITIAVIIDMTRSKKR